MGRIRNSLVAALALLVTGALLGSVVAPADAARRPSSRAEAAAIKRVAMRACHAPVGTCRYGGARISTRNARFAWADVTTEGFSGVLLKRPGVHSHRFRVIGTQGGGIGSCRYWRARAPRPVLRDLHVSGLLDIATGDVGSCG